MNKLGFLVADLAAVSLCSPTSTTQERSSILSFSLAAASKFVVMASHLAPCQTRTKGGTRAHGTLTGTEVPGAAAVAVRR